jgi:mono/diheme cytochrome c family protein
MIWLKRIGIMAGALLAALMLAVITIFAVTSSRFNTEYDVTAEPLVVPSDSMTISHGRHIVTTRGCAECHGEGLGGHIFMDNPAMGLIVGSNLTGGTGGVGSTYTDADWVRAIRHGIGTDDKPLMLMPSEEYYFLSDHDLGALVAYLKSLPPMDNTPPETSVGLMTRALFQFGKMPALVSAEVIHHDAPRPDAPEPGPTAEYGAYLTRGCIGCHTSSLTGGPPVAPGWPPAPDITGSGNLEGWDFEYFQILLHTGEHPDGRILNPKFMPWTAFGQLTDTEHLAIWNYLRSL